MAFKRYEGASTEYQGTSFTRTLIRKDNGIWESNNIGDWKLVDGNSTTVAFGDMVKVNDDFTVKIPK